LYVFSLTDPSKPTGTGEDFANDGKRGAVLKVEAIGDQTARQGEQSQERIRQ